MQIEPKDRNRKDHKGCCLRHTSKHKAHHCKTRDQYPLREIGQDKHPLSRKAVDNSTSRQTPKHRTKGDEGIDEIKMRRSILLGKIPGYREKGEPLRKARDGIGREKEEERAPV